MDMNKPEGSEDKSEQEIQDYLNGVKDALRKCSRDPNSLGENRFHRAHDLCWLHDRDLLRQQGCRQNNVPGVTFELCQDKAEEAGRGVWRIHEVELLRHDNISKFEHIVAKRYFWPSTSTHQSSRLDCAEKMAASPDSCAVQRRYTHVSGKDRHCSLPNPYSDGTEVQMGAFIVASFSVNT